MLFFFSPRIIRSCLSASYHHFEVFLMYEICLHFIYPLLFRLHLFRWFYDVNSAKTHQIGYLLSPNILFSPKTDDSKYNYIHFLLLFSPFSLHILLPFLSYRMDGHDDRIRRGWIGKKLLMAY
jgi:hypothetical protein